MAENVMITGVAGFIGFHLASRLLAAGYGVVGIDALNAYYDPALKQARLNQLLPHKGFQFHHLDCADKPALMATVEAAEAPYVVHLAAQAGVRYSLENPDAYGEANLKGFLNILEACRHTGIQHLLYASSSSVYGGNAKLPFSEEDAVDHPVSLYAATKKANELMAHTYSHLYGLPTTGLRFFTVYGPWGRPDMAYYGFTQKLFSGAPITLFNKGDMGRDFTYIDDIVEALQRLLHHAPAADPAFDPVQPKAATSWAPYRVYNIGNDAPARLGTFLSLLEKHTGRRATIEYADMQPGDVQDTWADVSALKAAIGFQPTTSLEEGLKAFVDWYKVFHGVK